jgi:hypothetical protein
MSSCLGIVADLRQEIHLPPCPTFPDQLSVQQRHGVRGELGHRRALAVDSSAFGKAGGNQAMPNTVFNTVMLNAVVQVRDEKVRYRCATKKAPRKRSAKFVTYCFYWKKW